ncbi:MAG: 50S ribosomal protein L4 [Deltaproteobacteria bacterium]|nr:50S ribosomal protein L4 [Deltaproteobacteria bacterium]
MTVDILNKEGVRVSSIELDKDIYEGAVNEALFYEVVKMQLANRRKGSASTKTRANVSGGGIKPWKQKGTGRARAGSNRSPLWRHGGTVFGPHPRDYSYLVPKRVRKDAVKAALRQRLADGRLFVFDSLDFGGAKTKQAKEIFKKISLDNALVVIEGEGRNARLSVRNMHGFKVLLATGINVYDILCYDNLVITAGALKSIEEKLQ